MIPPRMARRVRTATAVAELLCARVEASGPNLPDVFTVYVPALKGVTPDDVEAGIPFIHAVEALLDRGIPATGYENLPSRGIHLEVIDGAYTGRVTVGKEAGS